MLFDIPIKIKGKTKFKLKTVDSFTAQNTTKSINSISF